MSAPPPARFTAAHLADIDTLVFDCDGVLFRGGQTIDGAADTLKHLRSLGKNVFFMTNNSTKSRRQYLAKFDAAGVEAKVDEVLSSSFAAAEYVRTSASFDKSTQQVIVVGEDGIALELAQAGIRSTKVSDVVPFGKRVTDDDLHAMDLPDDVGAVIVGYDGSFTYSKAAYAVQFLHRDRECMFVSTNQDATFPAKHGLLLPGGGSVVAMMKTAALREPVNVGKPEKFLLDVLVERFEIDLSRTLVVGDRMDTDILIGSRGGTSTLLVLTGVTQEEHVSELAEFLEGKGGAERDAYLAARYPGVAAEERAGMMPTFIAPSVTALLADES